MAVVSRLFRDRVVVGSYVWVVKDAGFSILGIHL